MTAPILVLWGIGPERHYRHSPRVPLKITAGTLAHCRDEASTRQTATPFLPGLDHGQVLDALARDRARRHTRGGDA